MENRPLNMPIFVLESLIVFQSRLNTTGRTWLYHSWTRCCHWPNITGNGRSGHQTSRRVLSKHSTTVQSPHS